VRCRFAEVCGRARRGAWVCKVCFRLTAVVECCKIRSALARSGSGGAIDLSRLGLSLSKGRVNIEGRGQDKFSLLHFCLRLVRRMAGRTAKFPGMRSLAEAFASAFCGYVEMPIPSA